MGRPAKERQATTTRMYAETIRLARTMASWEGLSMSDYLDKLVKEDAARKAGGMIKELQALAETEAPAAKKPRRKADEGDGE